MTKREWASDLECLVFSDMVYEDLKDGDARRSLVDIFSNKNRFYKPNKSLRDERFKEYCRAFKQIDDLKMSNWQFIMKEGTNGHKNQFAKKSWGDVINKLFKERPVENTLKYLNKDLGSNKCIWEEESGGFYAAAFKHSERDEILITYRGTDQNYEDHLMTNILIAAGMPSEQFEKAVTFYKRVMDRLKDEGENLKEYKFTFTGHSLGGGLAQYAAIMAEEEVNYQCITWNGIGIKDLSYFSGNEFLDYREAVLDFFEMVGDENVVARKLKQIKDQFRQKKQITDSNQFKQKNKNRIDIDTAMKKIKEVLLKEGVLKKTGDIVNISPEYRNQEGNKLAEDRIDLIQAHICRALFQAEYKDKYNKRIDDGIIINSVEKMWKKLKSNFEVTEREDRYYWNKLVEKAKKFVKQNFNRKIIERKMRFIDKYKKYSQRKVQASHYAEKEYINDIITYSNSYDLTGTILNHVGSCLLGDKGLRYWDNGSKKRLFNVLKKVHTENLKFAAQHGCDVFYPYILLKEGANGDNPENRYEKPAEVGDLTDNLSRDYLRAIVKTIMLDISKRGTKTQVIKDIFIKYKKRDRFQDSFIKVLKAALANSAYQQGRQIDQVTEKSLDEYWIRIHQEEIEVYLNLMLSRNDKPELILDDENVKYKLDTAILSQFTQMSNSEIRDLWKWKENQEQTRLLLGTKGITKKKKATIYHSLADKKFDITNKFKELTIKGDEASSHVIYGSLKKKTPVPGSTYTKRCSTWLDKESKGSTNKKSYYDFYSQSGFGSTIGREYPDSDQDPQNRKMKIDGSDITGKYEEKKREKANIEDRNKTLRDRYFGDNIILRDGKKRYGKLQGKLIYTYGSNKEDQVIIDGFLSGDYGIKLKPMTSKQKEEDPPRTYTPHKVRLNKFEFEVLDRLEVKKSLYDHTRAVVEGKIDADKWQEYRKKLSRSKPKVEINYHDDNRKILFKGYINKHNLYHKNHEYYLKLEAISYTAILDRKQRTRIFQNQGTTYGDVFKVIEDKAKADYDVNFNIVCDDSSLEDKPLVTEEQPVVLQYRETDWEFLQRICSYLNKPIIIDDMKDTSETINILVGTHAASGKDLNNITGRMKRKTVEDPYNVYDYYKVEKHPHYRSDEIFNLGKPVHYVDHLTDTKRAQLKELILIKNRIYVKQGLLYSDLTMTAEDKINIQQRKWRTSFVGTAFRAEVKKVNNKYQAQVKFLDVYNQYLKDKAHWYSIDKQHTNAYFAPEVGDVVDVCFGSSNEQYGRVKSSSVVNGEETEHPPHVKRVQVGENKLEIDGEKEKVRAAAGEEEKVYLDVTSEKIELANRDQSLNVEKDKIKFENPKNKLEVNEDEIRMESGASRFVTDDEKTELKCGEKGITITEDKIKMP